MKVNKKSAQAFLVAYVVLCLVAVVAVIAAGIGR